MVIHPTIRTSLAAEFHRMMHLVWTIGAQRIVLLEIVHRPIVCVNHLKQRPLNHYPLTMGTKTPTYSLYFRRENSDIQLLLQENTRKLNLNVKRAFNR